MMLVNDGGGGRNGLLPGMHPPDEHVPILNRHAAALGLTITFTALAWLCSFFRLYTRLVIVKSPWWDDVFIVLALLSATAGSVAFILLQSAGMGRHLDTLSSFDTQSFIKYFYFGGVTYPLALLFIKLALLFQYLRIFDRDSRRHRFCKGFIVFTSIWGLLYLAPFWVPCYPILNMWDFDKPPPRCWGFASLDKAQAMGFQISQSVSTTLIDLVIFFLPLHLVLRPRTQRTSRIALVLLFTLGLVVSLCSITRLIFLLEPGPGALADVSWYSPTPTALAVIEVSLASVCAALPVFWPVIENTWGMIFVKYEVKITNEVGVFVPRKEKTARQLQIQQIQQMQLEQGNPSDVELARNHSGRSSNDERHLPQEAEMGDLGEELEWDPYVGDAKTGLGESDTVVQSPADGPPRRGKGVCCIF
ncbi:hypothetical protein B0T24DRAFT_422036 [Lasiosphaeria ovina]|uniref:Rhodopsin domain-containing protein n=1 Tax=Lasiosphaeria ovina TaxID=92902 RepID=A0AAE0JV93_9PEZI|nr:hypothetical protein B0T24DRAFT_422036 [Lasiosphaeria ovina]